MRRRRYFYGLCLTVIFALAIFVTLVADISSRDSAPATAESVASWSQSSFPLEGFTRYTSPFGYRQHPRGGGRRFHYGLDLAAPYGSYIRNWWKGTVVVAEDKGACGSHLTIKSGAWTAVYCHMKGNVVVEADGSRAFVDKEGGILIRVGDTVETGQRIGRVGMTGSTTGPHLHWGLKYDGVWIDPALVLKAGADAMG